jgi:thioredoxin-dependent peroxiredoxin
MLAPGTPAPPFALPDQHGTTVRLADLAGQWVVLWWFPKADTPG